MHGAALDSELEEPYVASQVAAYELYACTTEGKENNAKHKIITNTLFNTASVK